MPGVMGGRQGKGRLGCQGRFLQDENERSAPVRAKKESGEGSPIDGKIPISALWTQFGRGLPESRLSREAEKAAKVAS